MEHFKLQSSSKYAILLYMHNWSTNEETLKRDPEKYTIWKLEQMVNFGLGDQKILEEELRKYWSRITIDPSRRQFLALLLYGN